MGVADQVASQGTLLEDLSAVERLEILEGWWT
jgi:hypothetical protein